MHEMNKIIVDRSPGAPRVRRFCARLGWRRPRLRRTIFWARKN